MISVGPRFTRHIHYGNKQMIGCKKWAKLFPFFFFLKAAGPFISFSLLLKERHSLTAVFLKAIEVMDQKSLGLTNSRRQCCVPGAHPLYLNYFYAICIALFPPTCNL